MIVAVVTTIQAITNQLEKKKIGTPTEKKLEVGVNLQLLEL